MRNVVFGLCLFTAACSGEFPSAPMSPSSSIGGTAATEAKGASQLPFRGTFDATEVHTGAFPLLHAILAGTGQATHLGRFTAQFIFDIRLDVVPPAGTGSFTLTAANGDTLFGSITGQGTTQNGVFTVVEIATITGGTGRFVNATGSFSTDRVFSAPLTSSASFAGTINLGH